MARTRVKPLIQVEEEIQSYTHYLNDCVHVIVGTGVEVNGTFIFDIPQQYHSYEIRGREYKALISHKPSWAPNKPKDTFRKEDLWTVIDALSNKEILDIGK